MQRGPQDRHQDVIGLPATLVPWAACDSGPDRSAVPEIRD